MCRLPVMMAAVLILPVGPVSAGAPPECTPTPTAHTRVAGADVVVLARAVRKTRRLAGGDRTRTRFAVEVALKGSVPRRIEVRGCRHWKCGRSQFDRGERVILFLTQLTRPSRLHLQGWSCANGFNANSLPFDASIAIVREVFEAAGKPMATIDP